MLLVIPDRSWILVSCFLSTTPPPFFPPFPFFFGEKQEVEHSFWHIKHDYWEIKTNACTIHRGKRTSSLFINLFPAPNGCHKLIGHQRTVFSWQQAIFCEDMRQNTAREANWLKAKPLECFVKFIPDNFKLQQNRKSFLSPYLTPRI